MDLNEQESIISDITLDRGAGSGTVAEIMANSAKIKGGALPGTITSYGGLISGVTGADLKVDSGRTFLRDSTSLDDVIINGGQLWAADVDPVTVANLTLNTESFLALDRPDLGLTAHV